MPQLYLYTRCHENIAAAGCSGIRLRYRYAMTAPIIKVCIFVVWIYMWGRMVFVISFDLSLGNGQDAFLYLFSESIGYY